PSDLNNFSPRVGFAYSTRSEHPFVIRGGAGLFYKPIPAVDAARVANEEGIGETHLRLGMLVPGQAAVFPSYSSPLVNCPAGTKVCTPPPSVAPYLAADISAFSPTFQTPHTAQANVSVQRELGHNLVLSAGYAYVHGMNEIRSLDRNLP